MRSLDPIATVQALRAACTIAGMAEAHAEAHAAAQRGGCTALTVLGLLAELAERWELELPPSHRSACALDASTRLQRYSHAEVLRLVDEGLTDREIAERVGARWDPKTGTAPSIRTIRRRHGVIRTPPGRSKGHNKVEG